MSSKKKRSRNTNCLVKCTSWYISDKNIDNSDEIDLEESCKEAEITLYHEYTFKTIDFRNINLKNAIKKRKSNRVRNIQDYFQWNDLTEENKDMYYDFVKRAKEFWENQNYNDDNSK